MTPKCFTEKLKEEVQTAEETHAKQANDLKDLQDEKKHYYTEADEYSKQSVEYAMLQWLSVSDKEQQGPEENEKEVMAKREVRILGSNRSLCKSISMSFSIHTHILCHAGGTQRFHRSCVISIFALAGLKSDFLLKDVSWRGFEDTTLACIL